MYTQDILGESILKSTITHTNKITGPSDNNDIIDSVTGQNKVWVAQSHLKSRATHFYKRIPNDFPFLFWIGGHVERFADAFPGCAIFF